MAQPRYLRALHTTIRRVRRVGRDHPVQSPPSRQWALRETRTTSSGATATIATAIPETR
jgi:hypothetical protein